MIYYVMDPGTGEFKPVPDTLKKGITVTSAAEVMPAIGKKIIGKVEQFFCLYLDNANRIIKASILSRGTDDQTAVYPREVAREMLRVHATGLIVAHNHPSGSNKPSPADIEITRKLKQCLDVFEFRFLDHVIISGPTTYFSFRENGLIP